MLALRDRKLKLIDEMNALAKRLAKIHKQLPEARRRFLLSGLPLLLADEEAPERLLGVTDELLVRYKRYIAEVDQLTARCEQPPPTLFKSLVLTKEAPVGFGGLQAPVAGATQSGTAVRSLATDTEL